MWFEHGSNKELYEREIVMRARRKYKPGSVGRQFATAVLVLGVVMIGGNIIFGSSAGAYSGIFSI